MIRDKPSFSAGPTARLWSNKNYNFHIFVERIVISETKSESVCIITWMLYPLLEIAPVIKLRTPGTLATSIDNVWERRPSDCNHLNSFTLNLTSKWKVYASNAVSILHLRRRPLPNERQGPVWNHYKAPLDRRHPKITTYHRGLDM